MESQAFLRQRLDDADQATRAFAAEDAGFDDEVEAIEPLVDRLRREPSRFVREAILTALTRMTHAIVGDHAVPLLESDDAFLRSAAVSLLQSRGPRALDLIERAFRLANADVRKLLLDTASALPGEDAERVLLLGLGDPDANVRIAAVEYLGDRVRPSLKCHFEALVRSESEPMLVSTALSALEQVGDASSWASIEERYLGSDALPPFLAPQLLRMMGKLAPETYLRRFFEEQSRIGPASLGDWLDGLEAFQDRFAFRSLPAEQFEMVQGLLGDCTTMLCHFRLLKWMGRLDLQPGVVEVLETNLASSWPMVRHGAALGLCRAGTARGRATLAARLPLERDDDVRGAILAGLANELGAAS